MSVTSYTVHFAPVSISGTWSSYIDVTDYVKLSGLPTIKKQLDATDYDIGIFTYDDLEILAVNVDGYFNDQSDSRSIFAYGRNRTKVKVTFTKDGTDTISFLGLIADDATRINAQHDEIRFRVLSYDSIFRDLNISAGAISNSVTCKNAMETIINVPTVTGLLTYSASNINPAYDFVINIGSYFDNITARNALNDLLIASNSVLYINESNEIIVSPRTESSSAITYLYGPFDLKQRTNILSLDSVNTGLQRVFTAFDYNDYVATDSTLSDYYGYRKKSLTQSFVTDSAVEQTIAETLLSEFKVQKYELEITVPSNVVRSIELLDRVSIDYPLRTVPISGKFLPVAGDTILGDVNSPTPNIYGSFKIDPSIAWKVIGIEENPSDFTTTLKMRQKGTTLTDGVF